MKREFFKPEISVSKFDTENIVVTDSTVVEPTNVQVVTEGLNTAITSSGAENNGGTTTGVC